MYWFVAHTVSINYHMSLLRLYKTGAVYCIVPASVSVACFVSNM